MSKWEYKVVEQNRNVKKNFLENSIESDFGNDENMPGWLDEHGAKGWELVSVVPIAEVSAPTMRLRYFFKRETY